MDKLLEFEKFEEVNASLKQVLKKFQDSPDLVNQQAVESVLEKVNKLKQAVEKMV